MYFEDTFIELLSGLPMLHEWILKVKRGRAEEIISAREQGMCGQWDKSKFVPEMSYEVVRKLDPLFV